MLSIHCPNCGGTSVFDETKDIPTYCTFCGAHFQNMDHFVEESLRLGLHKQALNLDREVLKIDRQRHDMDMERINKEIKKERVHTFTDKVELLIGLITILLVFYIVFKNT